MMLRHRINQAPRAPYDAPSPRPARDQPGTYQQQWDAIAIYLDDPARVLDREDAWDRARRLVIPHARRREDLAT